MGYEVEIVGDDLECSVDGKPLWSTPISAIVLIAEYTTNEGPWGEDYFLLIKSFERGALLEARIGDGVIGGLSVLLRRLEERLNTKLNFRLMSVTVWDSRVMWPESIAGERYFTLDPIPPVGIWEKLKKLCFGPPLSLAMTKPVIDYLKQYEIPPTG